MRPALRYNGALVSNTTQTEGAMPRRRKPAGLECLVELARKAEVLEREMSAQREAIARLTAQSADRATSSDSPNPLARMRPLPVR
jgi:hypothetical protein